VGFKLIRFWWIEEKIEPLLITHQRVDLPDVRSRMAEIDAYLTACQGHHRLCRLHGRHRRWIGGPEAASMQRASAALDDQLD
jgi:hypothetical protein